MTATVEQTMTPLEQARERLAGIDGRLGEIAGRLAEIPGQDAAVRLDHARGSLSDRQASKRLGDLARETEGLEAERDSLARDRDAVTLVIGEHETVEREARATEALAAGEAVQARIIESWGRVGELLAGLADAWGEIVEAEIELAGLREQIPDMQRRGQLASPSQPLPVSFRAFVDRAFDAAVDPRQLGRDHPIYGQVGQRLPDLSGHRLGRVWLPGITSYETS